MKSLRIPFLLAVTDPLLLKGWFTTLSFGQQTVLLAMYGCPLDSVETDIHGWTRMDYWWACQGYAKYDLDGYIKEVNPPDGAVYEPQEYGEVWVIAGVRGGKSDRIAATAVVYEAVFGGHEAYVRKGKLANCLQICQDLRLARQSLHGIEATVKSIPLAATLQKTQWSGKDGEYIGRRTADNIELRNGTAINTMPPTVKAIRGYDAPVAVLDEVGVWPTEAEAANVDHEVYAQAKSRQKQFAYPKIIGISSPWIASGKLYDMSLIGTRGAKIFCAGCERRKPLKGCEACARLRAGYKNVLVCHFTTASLGNPLVTRETLEADRLQDPNRFRRECLAEFSSSASAFLPSHLLDAAVSKGIRERSPLPHPDDPPGSPIPLYVAALDPAFRRDSFGFGIAHTDTAGKIVIDVIRVWKPAKGAVLRPETILDEIAPLMHQFRCVSASCDQHNFDALAQLCLQRGFALDLTNFSGQGKNDIFGNLYTIVAQERLDLLDDDGALHELKSLQRKLSSGGATSIEAPSGQHDDMAVVIALLAKRAIWLSPAFTPVMIKPKTLHEEVLEQIGKRESVRDSYYDEW